MKDKARMAIAIVYGLIIGIVVGFWASIGNFGGLPQSTFVFWTYFWVAIPALIGGFIIDRKNGAALALVTSLIITFILFSTGL